MRFRERIRLAGGAREDNESAIDGSSKPGGMCMPPERPFLSDNVELVRVAPPWLDRTLGNVNWAVSPWAASLGNTMPARRKMNSSFRALSSSRLRTHHLPVDCQVVGRLVEDVNDDGVAFVCLYHRSRQAPVYRYHCSFLAQLTNGEFSDLVSDKETGISTLMRQLKINE